MKILRAFAYICAIPYAIAIGCDAKYCHLDYLYNMFIDSKVYNHVFSIDFLLNCILSPIFFLFLTLLSSIGNRQFQYATLLIAILLIATYVIFKKLDCKQIYTLNSDTGADLNAPRNDGNIVAPPFGMNDIDYINLLLVS